MRSFNLLQLFGTLKRFFFGGETSRHFTDISLSRAGMASWIVEKQAGVEVELQIQGQASGVSCSLHTVSLQ